MSSGGGSGLPGMTRIIADISVSLDRFVTEPDPSPDNAPGTAARERAEASSSDGGKDLDVIRMGGRRDTTVHRRSAAHAGAA
jgi:hypothetical protein